MLRQVAWFLHGATFSSFVWWFSPTVGRIPSPGGETHPSIAVDTVRDDSGTPMGWLPSFVMIVIALACAIASLQRMTPSFDATCATAPRGETLRAMPPLALLAPASIVEPVIGTLLLHKFQIRKVLPTGMLLSLDFPELCAEAELEGVRKRLKPDATRSSSLDFSDFLRNLAPFVAAQGCTYEEYESAAAAARDPDRAEYANQLFFEPWEELLLTSRRLQRVDALGCAVVREVRRGEPLLHALEREGTIDPVECVVPLHTQGETSNWPCFALTAAGLDEIHRLFGDSVSMYFVFLRTYTIWLMLPAALWCIAEVMIYADVVVDRGSVLPVFALIILPWTALLPRLTQRADSHFACRWGRLHATDSHAELNPRFQGHYDGGHYHQVKNADWKRFAAYAFSVAVTIAMMLVVVCVQIVSLNFQGYISAPDSSAAHGLELTFDSPFYLPAIGKYAEPGMLFDPTGFGDPYLCGWLTLVPVLAHVVVVSSLNKSYARVAVILTDMENHRKLSDRKNSLICKRFAFEAFDAFLPLVYVAFFKQSAHHLYMELCALYSVDSLRRILVETLLPLAIHRRGWIVSHLAPSGKLSTMSVLTQLELDRSDDFDDYLEIIIQLGYVTLFAIVFPWAAALSIVCNIVESYSDSFKLRHAYRRPRALAANGMPESWRMLIACICRLSAVTNVVLFALVASPSWRVSLSCLDPWDRNIWKALFVVENVLLILCSCVSTCMPTASAIVQRMLVTRERFQERAVQLALRKH